MKQEDKDLLVKDLCSRLPYGVQMNHIADNKHQPATLIGIAKYMITLQSSCGYSTSDIEDYKPYLFPLSSMTNEQLEELGIERDKDTLLLAQGLRRIGEGDKSLKGKLIAYNAIDWLNAHHFDYRGLLEKGLAIDCTNLNIY